jgi:hypothetical protein
MKILLPLVAAAILAFASPLYAQTASNPGSGSSGASLGPNTYTGPQTMPAATTSAPSLNMPQGVAPTTPANGAKWSTSSGEYGQFGGQTFGPYGKFTITGTPAIGDCASFASATSLQDAGSTCGSGTGGGLAFSGSVSAGDCAQIASSTQLSDSGGPCFPAIYQPPFIPNNYYLPPFTSAAAGSPLSAGRAYFAPFVLLRPMKISDIAIRILTAYSGGNIIEGIYASNDGTGRPTGSPIVFTPSLSTTTAGMIDGAFAAGAATLPAGHYWIADLSDNSTAACQVMAQTQAWMTSMFGSPTLINADDGTNEAGLEVYTSMTFSGGLTSVTSASWGEYSQSIHVCLPVFKVSS